MGRISNEYFIKHPTWPTEWILHTVPMFYNDFMFTGNIESVRTYYEELKYKDPYFSFTRRWADKFKKVY